MSRNIFVNMTDPSFLTEDVMEKMRAIGNVTFSKRPGLVGEELAEGLRGQDVLITGWGQHLIRKEDIGDAKLLVHTGGTVGGVYDLDIFDTDVKIISGNTYYAESTAEGVLSYMLFALRDMGTYSHALSCGEWLPSHTNGLLDQTVGIISLGAISKRLIEMLSLFRAKIKLYSRSHDMEYAEKWGITYADLDEIFATCKVISVHTAQNPQTYHMINDHHFKLIQPGSIFLNTSRGSVIDQDALVENLKDGRFTAVLDVYNQEPLPKDSPLVGMKNAILFPHQAGPTYDRRHFITGFLLDDVQRFFDGKPLKNQIEKRIAERMTQN